MIYDYVIVGAGILGSATAKYLIEALPEKDILLAPNTDRNYLAALTVYFY